MPDSQHTAPTVIPPAYDRPFSAHEKMLRDEYDRCPTKALVSITLDGRKTSAIAFGDWVDADDMQFVGVLTTEGEYRDASDLNATDAAACEEELIATSEADRADGGY